MHHVDQAGARWGPWATLLLALYLGTAVVLGEELSGLAVWARVPAVSLLAALAAVATAWATQARDAA